MFIGGLNWDTTDGTYIVMFVHPCAVVLNRLVAESLRKYFTQFGKVEACTIMRDAAGRSRCFAFLTFEDPASVNAVMVREHFLDGKIVSTGPFISEVRGTNPLDRSTRSAPSRGRSISVRRSFSSAACLAASRRSLCGSTSPSLARSLMRPSCLTARRDGAKASASCPLRTLTYSPCLVSATCKSTASSYVFAFHVCCSPSLTVLKIDVKLAQPRSQREGGFAEGGGNGGAGAGVGGGGAGRTGGYGNNASAYGTQNFAGGASAGAQAGGNAPFDPQALAQLYTRMISQIGGMNPMMGAMNPAMMGGQYGAPGMGGGAGGMGMRGMGGGMGGGRGGAGMGGPGMGVPTGPASLGPNVPRGPRNAPTGPSGGVGPQRGQRGQHSYHPYAR